MKRALVRLAVSAGILGVWAVGLGANGGDCSPIPIESACASDADCPFGERCEASGCAPAECHVGSSDGAVPPLRCPEGTVCDYASVDDRARGLGWCTHVACTSWWDCPFGHRCEAGRCTETPCHGAAPDGTLAPRDCPAGSSCTYGDSVDVNFGQGFCEPDPECAANTDCAWGHECRWGACEESPCHPASPDGALPPRSCPPPGVCVYGDSIDAGHGNGTCDYGP
jgi:hypothetical protein